MQRKFIFILAVMLSAGFVVACGEDDVDPVEDTGGGDTVDDTSDAGNDADAVEEVEEDVTQPDVITGDETKYSFVAGLLIPSTNGGDACCFTDLDPSNDDPDPTIDNNLAALLGVLGTFLDGVDINASIQEAVDAGDLALVLEHVNVPDSVNTGGQATDATVNLYLATADEGDTAADRASGDGTFTLGEATATFDDVTVGEGQFAAGPDTFPLTIPLGALGGSDLGIEELDLTVTDARIEGEIVECNNGVCSVDPLVSVDGEDVQVGGMKLGGAVGADQIVTLINDLVADCSCISADLATEPMILGGEDADAQSYVLECNSAVDTSSANCGDEDGAICGGLGGNIGTVCSALGVVGNLIDVDIDGNGINDGISLGIRLSLVGATPAAM